MLFFPLGPEEDGIFSSFFEMEFLEDEVPSPADIVAWEEEERLPRTDVADDAGEDETKGCFAKDREQPPLMDRVGDPGDNADGGSERRKLGPPRGRLEEEYHVR